MKATITQINASQLESDWNKLVQHVKANQSEFVLLPEMCFSEWFCVSKNTDDAIWNQAVETHNQWLERLPELGAKMLVGTAPRNVDNKKHNVAYVWTADAGIQWIHSKTYLPNEEGYWEATWYDRAPIDFQPITVEGITIGVAICTEMWFMHHIRAYSQQGIHLMLNPRSTPFSTNEKWLIGGQTAGVIAGAYCLSSNHAGVFDEMKLGGAGWISDPGSNVLGVTSEDAPFTTVEIDLSQAESAKSTYPRYVDDSDI